MKSSHGSYYDSGGWTLLELLCVLAIIGVSGLGFLFFSNDMFQNNRCAVIRQQIMSAVAYSRNTALVLGKAVALNPLDADWSRGMVLFVDNKTHVLRPTDTVLHVWQWKPAPFTVVWFGFRSRQYIVFAPEAAHAASNGHFSIRYKTMEKVQLVVNRLGRIHEEGNNISRSPCMR